MTDNVNDGKSVDARWWAFVILGAVIALDVARAVGSRRVARREHSPALTASALHFASDLAAGNLPNYSFISPNGCDTAHDCGLSTADNWLKSNIDPLIKNAAFQKDGLLIVVFDESGSDNTNGGGRVVSALISPAFSKLGYQSTLQYQHESVLRLMLEGLGVTALPGASSGAPTMSEFFNTTGGGPAATACTLYVSPSGSDSNAGTLSAPWKTVQKAFNSATAGQTVCFRGGTYPQYVAATSGFNQVENNSGSSGNPIVFTNYPGEVAIVQGSTRVNGSHVTFRGTPQGTGSCDAINPCGLIFEGSTGYVLPAVSICCAVNENPNFVLFDHVEIRKGTYHAGIYEEGCNNAIIGSYVHDNGLQDRNEDNGIYWSVTPPGCANGGLIANNLVEHNYSKGIQLYDGGSATEPAFVTVTENTSVNNGSVGALIWGDHNVFVNNVLYNNNNDSGGPQSDFQPGQPHRLRVVQPNWVLHDEHPTSQPTVPQPVGTELAHPRNQSCDWLQQHEPHPAGGQGRRLARQLSRRRGLPTVTKARSSKHSRASDCLAPGPQKRKTVKV